MRKTHCQDDLPEPVAKPRGAEPRRLLAGGTRAMLAVLVLAFALVVAACGDDDDSRDQAASGGSSEPAEPAEVTYLSSIPIPHVYDTPWFVGQELGYFEDEGIDLKIEHTSGSEQAISLLIAGKGDFAAVNSAPFVEALNNGRDLTSIYNWVYQTPFMWAAPEGSEVTEITADQLRGKTIGITEFAGGEVALVRGYLEVLGLAEGEDVQLLPIGEGDAATVQALRDGQADVYVSNRADVATINAAGLPMTDITPDEMNTFPGAAVIVSPETLENESDALTRTLRALAKATLYTETNMDAAIQAMGNQAPEAVAEEEFATNFLEAVFPTFVPPDSVDGFGYHLVDGWQAYVDFLAESGGLEGDLDITSRLTDDLLAEVNEFDHEEVTREANAAGSE
jgi:NitT/TauT family transport system substrate-binding protein